MARRARAGARRLSPVLCFLHGYDEGAPARVVDGLTRHGPLAHGASPRSEGFLVVAPQLPERGDRWGRYVDGVARIVREVQTRLGGDPARTYLTGFSYGANGVFDLGASDPATWAALWAVDPTRVPPEPLAAPLWLSVGQAARPARARYVERLQLAPPGREPGDRVVLDQGADHIGSARLAYADERIYAWLLERRR